MVFMTYITNRTGGPNRKFKIPSTQRLFKVFKKQRENKKCETLIFLFVIFSCNISYTQPKQITSSTSSSTRWSVSSSFSDSKISTGSLFAENLPVTECLSRRILYLIFCIPVIRCSKLFFRLSRGKLVDVSLLKHQFKTLLDILMSLNDGFHDLYNEQNWWTESKIQNSVHAKAV